MTTLQLALTAAIGLEGIVSTLLGLFVRRARARAETAVELAEEAREIQVGRRRADPRDR